MTDIPDLLQHPDELPATVPLDKLLDGYLDHSRKVIRARAHVEGLAHLLSDQHAGYTGPPRRAGRAPAAAHPGRRRRPGRTAARTGSRGATR